MPEETPKKNYRLTITRVAPNPEYAKEIEDIEKHRNRMFDDRGRDFSIPPQKEITTDILITEITEEQFKVIRAESLKVF